MSIPSVKHWSRNALFARVLLEGELQRELIPLQHKRYLVGGWMARHNVSHTDAVYPEVQFRLCPSEAPRAVVITIEVTNSSVYHQRGRCRHRKLHMTQ